MSKILKYLIALTLLIYTWINVHAQSNVSIVDSLTQEKRLKIYRQIFWDSLPKPYNWVNDYEGLFSDSEENKLDSIVKYFEKESTIEIAIVTIDSVFTAKDQFDNLALHIAKSWGVGKKEKFNGILIAISRGHRRIRIENARGIEKLITDEDTKKIISNYFIPFFKSENYFTGTVTGLTELIELLKTRIK